MPAIGARTTGESMTCRPMRRGGSTRSPVAEEVSVGWVRVVMTMASVSPGRGAGTIVPMGSGTEAPTGRDTRATLRPVLPWLVVMLVLGASAVTLGVQRLEALPDPYPTHFDLSGEADGFSDRSLGSVLMPVVLGPLG